MTNLQLMNLVETFEGKLPVRATKKKKKYPKNGRVLVGGREAAALVDGGMMMIGGGIVTEAETWVGMNRGGEGVMVTKAMAVMIAGKEGELVRDTGIGLVVGNQIGTEREETTETVMIGSGDEIDGKIEMTTEDEIIETDIDTM